MSIEYRVTHFPPVGTFGAATTARMITSLIRRWAAPDSIAINDDDDDDVVVSVSGCLATWPFQNDAVGILMVAGSDDVVVKSVFDALHAGLVQSDKAAPAMADEQPNEEARR